MLVCGSQLRAQDEGAARLRAQQDSLTRIRREREALQQRMRGLQNKAHDISEEVDNLNRQHNATVRVVHTLDQQLTTLNGEVEHTTANLVRAQDEVQVKQAILSRRLVEIYKRGPLYSLEVMLSAKSFGDLVARYKYLHILAQRDRAVLGRVDQLRTMIIGQRRQLVSLQNGVEQNRTDKAEEAVRLAALERVRVKSLAQVQQDAKKAKARLGSTTSSPASNPRAAALRRGRAPRPPLQARSAHPTTASSIGRWTETSFTVSGASSIRTTPPHGGTASGFRLPMGRRFIQSQRVRSFSRMSWGLTATRSLSSTAEATTRCMDRSVAWKFRKVRA